MGKARKTQRCAVMKRRINPNDSRLKKPSDFASTKGPVLVSKKKKEAKELAIKEVAPVDSSMFFNYNTNLCPPYQVIIDTNFINFSIQNKVDLLKGMMDCLLAKCVPCITDCVIAELEKMGHRYRLALRLARDSRFRRLRCTHKGTYADDCIVQRITEHRCYIVATNDKDLKRRIRKVPGVPILYVTQHKYAIERLPDAITALPAK
eukprot:GHVS01005779.1.p2 GENE.GHVS01005779.1~~GHVS01005779.1.p2  ORF type:complete len:206 (-),score=15.39 GHVS01005779.1:147-764(-)